MTDIYTWKPRLLKVRSLIEFITTDTDGPTITFDGGGAGGNAENSDELVGSDWHQVVLGGNRTLAYANVLVGQTLKIILQQDGTGSRTVTWFSGILWAGGSPPTLTTGAGKRDLITLYQLSQGVFLGNVVQNF